MTTANPLAGISVPSAKELAARVVAALGNAKIDLAQPIQQERLRRALEEVIGWTLAEMQTALLQSQDKAVRHVFELIKDPGYQQKRMQRQAVRKVNKKNAEFKKRTDAKRTMRITDPHIN